MTNPKNPSRPEEIGGCSDSVASGAMLSFYTDTFNSRNYTRLPVCDRDSEYLQNNTLPDCIIGGNCQQEGFEERMTSDGQTIVRDTRRNHFTVSSADGSSTFYQNGIGSDAHRTWIANDGRMIERDADSAYIYLRRNYSGGGAGRRYEIDLDEATVSSEADGWQITQQTTENTNQDVTNTVDGTLNIDVQSNGLLRQTSLNFFANGVSYHASDEGIEIIVEGGQYRFLLKDGALFALTPVPSGMATLEEGLYTGTDGRSYRSRAVSNSDAARIAGMLGLHNLSGVVADGLLVSVDANGNVIAHTEEESGQEPLSITIGPNGTQTVTTADGYTSRIGPDGRMQIFDPFGNCEAFFDPFSGIVGNANVQFGEEFSNVDGLHINLMGMVFERIALHRFVEDRAQANARATVALQQSQTDMDFVKGHLDSGTVGPFCFSTLTGSVNQLTAALGTCLAAGANENIGAVVAALGAVYSQLTLAHFKYNSQLQGQSLGVNDHYLLARMQQVTGATSDSLSVARQVAPAAA